MAAARIHGTVWTWRHTALVSAVVLTPVLGLGVSARGDLHDRAEHLDALIVWPAALVAAFACFAAWCIRPRLGLAWATIGLAVLGFHELARVAGQLVAPELLSRVEVLKADVAVALIAGVAVAFSHHVTRLPHPAVTGFGLGGLVAAVGLAGFHTTADFELHPRQWVVGVIYAAVIVGLAAAISWGGGLSPRHASVGRWARQRTALAVVMIGGAHLALYLRDTAAVHEWVVVADTVGAVLLLSSYVARFLGEVEAADRAHDDLAGDLDSAVRIDHTHRARLHEMRSTIAGIASASQFLRSTRQISQRRRTQLDDMIAAELGRLERLLALPSGSATSQTVSDGGAFPARVIDLDSMMGLIVFSHEARGHRVGWTPSGLRVRAQPDAVAQVFNVLLDNAAKHGRSTAEVTVQRHGEYAEVAVHDDGPGVDPSIRGRLFEWGVRDPRSTGQGIGLHMARDLALQQRGYLQLRDIGSSGATFVLGLPLDQTDGEGPGALGGDGTSLRTGDMWADRPGSPPGSSPITRP